MTSDEMVAALTATGDYRVLRRLFPHMPNTLLADPAGAVAMKRGLILDTETTGLDPDKDEIIELAMLPFTFGTDGVIYEVGDPLVQLRQPAKPIPAEITEITGIDDAMVAGAAIDLDAVAAALAPAAIVIAHNAAFDRPFAEKLSDDFVRKCWACAMTEIEWQKEGLHSRSLAALLMEAGLFYDRHRALSDCQALIELLARPLPKSGVPALAALLERARQPSWMIWALDSPFQRKDDLKARGYRWNPGDDGRPKSWHIEVRSAEAREAELHFLKTEIYRRLDAALLVEGITAFDRFAPRQLRASAAP